MSPRIRTALVLVALSAGALASIAGSPRPPLAADEIEAVELAGWIRDRRPGLLVVDARDADSIAHPRIPGAQPVAAVAADTLNASALVVVYSTGDVDDASVETLRRGSGRVLRLHGGIEAWNADVLHPTIRADAPEARHRAFAPRARLSRYFGGAPRVLEPGESPDRIRSRQGC